MLHRLRVRLQFRMSPDVGRVRAGGETLTQSSRKPDDATPQGLDHSICPRQPAGSGLDDHQPALARQRRRTADLFHRSGNGGRPDLRSQLTLDRATRRNRALGTILQLQPRPPAPGLGPLYSHWRGWRAVGSDYWQPSFPLAPPCWCLPASRLGLRRLLAVEGSERLAFGLIDLFINSGFLNPSFQS